MTPAAAEQAAAEQVDALLDTSAAVALVLVDHEHHTATARALRGRRLGLSGHAVFETFSVLTRLPAPLRRTPAVVETLMQANFGGSRHLSKERAATLLPDFVALGIAGGAVYDALVGAAAAEHQLPLVSRDLRAAEIYRLLGVDVELLR